MIHIVGVTPAGFREKVDLDGKPGRFPGAGGGGGGAMVFSGRLATDADIDGGLRVRALFFANSLEIRNELLYAMGAGWESYTIGNALEDVRVPLAVVIETGSMLPSTLLALAVVVEDPSIAQPETRIEDLARHASADVAVQGDTSHPSAVSSIADGGCRDRWAERGRERARQLADHRWLE